MSEDIKETPIGTNRIGTQRMTPGGAATPAFPSTLSALHDAGYKPSLIVAEEINGLGYTELVTDASGMPVRTADGRNYAAVRKHWNSREEWKTIYAALVEDGFEIPRHLRAYGGEDGNESAVDFPIDNAIVLRRQSLFNPSTEATNALLEATDLLTSEQLEEYEARYAKMYGEDTVHE